MRSVFFYGVSDPLFDPAFDLQSFLFLIHPAFRIEIEDFVFSHNTESIRAEICDISDLCVIVVLKRNLDCFSIEVAWNPMLPIEARNHLWNRAANSCRTRTRGIPRSENSEKVIEITQRFNRIEILQALAKRFVGKDALLPTVTDIEEWATKVVYDKHTSMRTLFQHRAHGYLIPIAENLTGSWIHVLNVGVGRNNIALATTGVMKIQGEVCASDDVKGNLYASCTKWYALRMNGVASYVFPEDCYSSMVPSVENPEIQVRKAGTMSGGPRTEAWVTPAECSLESILTSDFAGISDAMSVADVEYIIERNTYRGQEQQRTAAIHIAAAKAAHLPLWKTAIGTHIKFTNTADYELYLETIEYLGG